MIVNPPNGVQYLIDPVKKRPNILFKIYRRYGSNKIARTTIHAIQKYIFSQDTDPKVDLLHVVDMTLPLKIREKNRYVVDIGYVGALASHTGIDTNIQNDILEYLLHSNCKSIILRSEAAKESVLRIVRANMRKAIEGKMVVIYPAYTPKIKKNLVWAKKKSILKSDKFKLLFIGNYVYGKGLVELLEAYIKLREIYRDQVSLTIIANDYDEVTKRYTAAELKGVNCHRAIFTPQQLIEKFYLKSHVFVLPSHHEIFGMVFIESLNSATPVIAINQYSTPEIIKDGYNGYLIQSEKIPYSKNNPLRTDFDPQNFEFPEQSVVEQIYTNLCGLVKNRKLLETMSKNALFDNDQDRKFSTIERNNKLSRLYEKAIN